MIRLNETLYIDKNKVESIQVIYTMQTNSGDGLKEDHILVVMNSGKEHEFCFEDPEWILEKFYNLMESIDPNFEVEL